MLDLKLIRGETEKVKAALARRKEVVDIDAVIAVDDKRRALLVEAEGLKAKQNEVTKQIPIMKKEGKDTTEVFAQMKEISEKVKELDGAIREVEEELNRMMLTIPNIPDESVPDGDTDEDNIEIRKFGEPKEFGFEPKAHWDLGKDLGIIDADTAAKITGTRFTVYKDLGARLERAVINYYLDTHTEKHGYRSASQV